jgi:hypothetical protein
MNKLCQVPTHTNDLEDMQAFDMKDSNSKHYNDYYMRNVCFLFLLQLELVHI